jgi:hypothetical protein
MEVEESVEEEQSDRECGEKFSRTDDQETNL